MGNTAQLDMFGHPVQDDRSAFHNTIGLKGETLAKAARDCVYQEDRVLNIFQMHRKEMTPFDVEYIYERVYSRIPITSIRRAMSNLTRDGKLIKGDNMKGGIYGKANHTWKLA